MRRQVAEMPRVRFVCERDVLAGPYDYAIGFLWDRNFDAMPGEFIYRRRLLLSCLGDVVAAHRVGNRPDRCEPRKVKRRWKTYGLLKRPRAEERAALLK